MNFFKNCLLFVPLIYTNIYSKYYSSKYIINICYALYLYKYKYYYTEKLINNALNTKLMITDMIYKKNIFRLNKVYLYTNLTDYVDVSTFFYKNNISIINKINKQTIIDIYKYISLEFDYNDDIRLKIFFSYNNINYIIYFSYNSFMENDNSEHYIPYPPYNEDIINQYRNGIIVPTYQNNKDLYMLFNMESKDILTIKINNIENTDLIKYFEMIKTPFNDFGLSYHTPVRLLWILYENNICENTFDNFYLKFLNMYFDESEMDLKEHFIELNKNDLEKNIISKRMTDILLKNN